jgi:protoporphyrinogen oxidase
MSTDSPRQFVIIGGGPAGLTAAYQLTKLGHKPIVLEKDAILGGISRTEEYKGNRFDMGGHRFFTKVKDVDDMWEEVLAADFLTRPRQSRIFYKSKFFSYPLKPANALSQLGLLDSAAIVLSYARWKLLPYRQEDTFEQWVTNRFGKRLFETFFKTYTEKVWGISTKELKAEWAAQRIKNLSLRVALLNMFQKPSRTVTTLIEQFKYPRLGPGMMWEAVGRRVEEAGGEIRLGRDCVALRHEGGRVTGVIARDGHGREEIIEGTDFITSMPLAVLVKRMDPAPPVEVVAAAGRLKYRDFLTVCLIVDRPTLFSDNWIYVHEPSVNVGRIQNFKNWSPDMVADPNKTSLGLEYFCNEGDQLWSMPDGKLVELAKRELAAIGLAAPGDVSDGCVFRVPKAYPVYDADYSEALPVLREYVNSLPNLQTVGRNGMHRYNNQDHSMLAAMCAVRNAVLGESHDLWAVNTDMEYHEEMNGRRPGRNANYVEEVVERGLAEVYRRLDRGALGVGGAALCALTVSLATLVLVVRGGAHVGATLGLLSNYLPGYSVTWSGALVGVGYGLLFGFAAGWAFAAVRNALTVAYFALLKRRAERGFLADLFEYV